METVLPEDVFLALGEAGVTGWCRYRSDHHRLQNERCRSGVAASGLPAVDGDDAHFELLVSDARDRSPQVNEHGFIDFQNSVKFRL